MGGREGRGGLVRHRYRQPSPLEGNTFWEEKGATAARFNLTNELQRLFASLCHRPNTPADSPDAAMARTTLPKHQLVARLLWLC